MLYDRCTMIDPARFYSFALEQGHNAARALHAAQWRIVQLDRGEVVIDCPLPATLLNLGGSLFGGFTPTYVDFVSVWTCTTTIDDGLHWFSTVNLRVDYLEPIVPPEFRLSGRLINCRQRDYLVETRFTDADDRLLAFGLTSLRRAADRRLE